MSMFVVAPIAASCAVAAGLLIGLRGTICAVVVAIGTAIAVAFV